MFHDSGGECAVEIYYIYILLYIIHINLCFSLASFQGDRSQVTQLLPWSNPCVGRAGCSIHQQASRHCIEGGDRHIDRQTPSSESSKYFQHFLTYHWYRPSSSSCCPADLFCALKQFNTTVEPFCLLGSVVELPLPVAWLLAHE